VCCTRVLVLFCILPCVSYTQLQEGDNLQARMDAMEEEVVIVDTSMMEGGVPVGLQIRNHYLMSRCVCSFLS